MTSTRSRPITTLAVSLMAVFSSPSFADHGGCPCKSETVLRNQNHVADTLDVFEPAQRAIVIWDGETETIILSTDVRLAGASQSGLIAEFIPLPNRPTVTVRPIEIFRRLADLDPENAADLLTFVPTHPAGALARMPTVSFVTQAEDLNRTLMQICSIDDAYRAPTEEIAKNYLAQGFPWFVFDGIEASSNDMSFPPIAYTFASDRLYYPLETSVMAQGGTRIDLALITRRVISRFEETSTPIRIESTIVVEKDQLKDILDDASFFSDQDAVVIQHISLEGELNAMRRDIVGR
jgi:hypothetical protein